MEPIREAREEPEALASGDERNVAGGFSDPAQSRIASPNSF